PKVFSFEVTGSTSPSCTTFSRRVGKSKDSARTSSEPFRARRIIRSSDGQSILGTASTLTHLPGASEEARTSVSAADGASPPQAPPHDLLMIRLHLNNVVVPFKAIRLL